MSAYDLKKVYNGQKVNRMLRSLKEKANSQEGYLKLIAEKKTNLSLKFKGGRYKSVVDPFRSYLLKEKITVLSSNNFSFKQFADIVDRYYENIKTNNLREYGYDKKTVTTVAKKKIVSEQKNAETTKGDRTEYGTLIKGKPKTADQESLACWMCAAVTGERKFKRSHYTKEVLSKYSNKVKGVVDLDHIYNVCDESWFESAYKTAICLLRKRYINSRMTFHLDSPLVKKINNHGKKLGLEIWQRGFLQLKLKMQKDRWNPADIWGFTTDKPDLLFSDNIGEFNDSLKRLLLSNEVCPISLKKVNSTTAQSKVYNVEKIKYNHIANKIISLRPRDKHFATRYYLNITYDNKANAKYPVISIDFDKGKGVNGVNFRINESARGGSAAGPHLYRISKNIGINLPSEQDLKNFSKKVLKNTKGPESSMLLSMIKQEHSTYSKDDFSRDINNSYNKKQASIMAMHFSSHLRKLDKKSIDHLITDILIFCESKSDWSGPFIKVY